MTPHSELAALAATVYRPSWSATVAGDVHYALVPRGGELVVALPGTHPGELADWIRDARFLPVWLGGVGCVHAGFGRGAEAAWREMAPILGRHDIITITGHSLGGGLGLCLAAKLAAMRPGVRFRVVVFAAPRVAFCNPWFHHLLSRADEAVVYARPGDIVPMIPFRPLYTHGVRTTYVGDDLGSELANHDVARFEPALKALGV